MAMTIRRSTVLALVALFAAFAYADDKADEPEADTPADAAQDRLVAIQEQLNLTDEQAELAKPILQRGFEAQAAVLEEHGFSRDGRARGRPSLREARKLRKLGGELDEIRKTTHDELAEVLTEEQLLELTKIQEESRKKLRERMRQRR